MKRTLVTTTINVPTVIEEWVQSGMDRNTDEVIVVGDEKTPHDDVADFLVDLDIEHLYLHPNDSTGFHVDPVIGHNVIQRRNLGFLAALHHPTPPDIIISIDDDNAPKKDWVKNVTRILTEPNTQPVLTSDTGWFNPGTLCEPEILQRGYPLSEIHAPGRLSEVPAMGQKIGVFQSLVVGDPDISAMERIVNGPIVNYVRESFTIGEDTWMPFNSQATAWRAELTPLMLMWPGVGRYDDIWASYLCQAVMQPLGYHVQVGHPVVRQERNPHNLIKDLKDEMLGYELTPVVVGALGGIKDAMARIIESNEVEDSHNIALAAVSAYKTLARTFSEGNDKLDVKLPVDTIAAFEAWIEDIEVLYK